MKQLLIKTNVGPRERIVRGVIALAAFIALWFVPGALYKTILAVICAYCAFTSASLYCPIEHALGIRNRQGGSRMFPRMLRRL